MQRVRRVRGLLSRGGAGAGMKGRSDIVIAGAGPAGCVAARLLAEQRMGVLLCEKRGRRA